tara:strand:- start:385 stop:612 length:228 start_codon:yes stop_codon:yes gene_type:complete
VSECGGGGGKIGIVCRIDLFPVLIAGRPLIYTLDEYPAPGGCTGDGTVNTGIWIGWISWFPYGPAPLLKMGIAIL